MFDLQDIDALATERFEVRNAVEKHVAVWQATGKRPTEYISQDEYDRANETVDSSEAGLNRVVSTTQEDVEGGTVHSPINNRSPTGTTASLSLAYSPPALVKADKEGESISRDREDAKQKSEMPSMGTGHTKRCDDVYYTAPKRVAALRVIPSSSCEGMLTNLCYGKRSICVDSINYYTVLLRKLNEDVLATQLLYAERKHRLEEAGNRMLQGKLRLHAHAVAGFLSEKLKTDHGYEEEDVVATKVPFASTATAERRSASVASVSSTSSSANDEASAVSDTMSNAFMNNVQKVAGSTLGKGIEEVMNVVGETAQIASKGAVKGLLEASRTLELLTFGAYYRTSSTAFVTFTSRIATASAYQMLLSHEFFAMKIRSAPNPKDIIWNNVSIPDSQTSLRQSISGYTIGVGAIFWSIVVGFIAAISNLDSLADEYSWINEYKDTWAYNLLNQYLAVLLLLILLTLLPFVFDMIARSYEGMKLESEIQNSIQTRYFHYQVANIYVALGLGSIANSIHAIIDSPQNILSILGASLPSVSTYFVSVVIVKTFTALPLELLRILPLLDILRVQSCSDKKKRTRRELRSGAFADPPMYYGWCYPNIMMVLMIMVTYAIIAPLLMPFCLVFFLFAYLMYKYQLLYVYITDYQSGGYMWYAVFDRSMICLIMAVLTLIGYYIIRLTYNTGALYSLVPLPFLLVYFWRFCDDRFKQRSLQLSLESAVDLDQITDMRKKHAKPIPHDFFVKNMYSQPSLGRTSAVVPTPYRLSGNSGTGDSGNNDSKTRDGGTATASRNTKWDVASSERPSFHPCSGTDASEDPSNRRPVSMRQSLGSGGMYAYDIEDDEDDALENERQTDMLNTTDATLASQSGGLDGSSSTTSTPVEVSKGDLANCTMSYCITVSYYIHIVPHSLHC